MAREIVALSPYELILREISDPVPDEGEVLVRSEFGAAKHGTEMASVKGYGHRGRFDPELRLFVKEEGQLRPPGESRVGNMIVGCVESLGAGVDTLVVGDTVAVHSSFTDALTRSASRCWKLE